MKKFLFVLVACILFASCDDVLVTESWVKFRLEGTSSKSVATQEAANEVGLVAMFATGSIIPALAASTETGKNVIGKVSDFLSDPETVNAIFTLEDPSITTERFNSVNYKVDKTWYDEHLNQVVELRCRVEENKTKGTRRLISQEVLGLKN